MNFLLHCQALLSFDGQSSKCIPICLVFLKVPQHHLILSSCLSVIILYVIICPGH